MNVLRSLVLVNAKDEIIQKLTWHIDSGSQPFISDDENLTLCVNGEIYNHEKLRCQLKKPYKFRSKSDSEIILACVHRSDIKNNFF